MKEQARHLHIVESEPVIETDKSPDTINEQLKAFTLSAKDFKGASSILVKGFVAYENEDATHRRLNIMFHNPDKESFGPVKTIAELAYRNISHPTHVMDKIYLRKIGDNLRLQRLERISQTSKFIYKDVDQVVVDEVSTWLECFHPDEGLHSL